MTSPEPSSSHPAPRRAAIAAATAALLLTACAAGPDYVRPALDLPAAYKETGPWKTAQPQAIPNASSWWEAFHDATLGDLVRQADAANFTLQQAEAQYRQARAVVDAARAAYWPSLTMSAGAGRARTNTSGIVKLGNDYSLAAGASWEPDLWGGVRRSVEAGTAGAQASADELAAARLSTQAALAQDYLQLRIIDLQIDLYATTTAAYEKALQLTRSQYAAGVVLRSDVALAETQLKTAQAQAVDLQALRAQLEHAIAILLGKAPAQFSLAAWPADAQALARLKAGLPAIPTGLPTDLLERRPDIAAAERTVAVANANIGVARAAYFPSLTLSAAGGFSSGALGALFDTPSRVWSLGAALAQTLFDGGLRKARDAQAVAAYDASVAAYKQTVLTSFQAVEDNLATLRVLDQESALQDDAVQAAQLAERLALSQYRGGTTTYLSVVTAQTLALANERTAVQLLGRRLAASVALITATGGGWSTATDVAASATRANTNTSAAAPGAAAASTKPESPS
jgi:NodT family efflux transporter outer membrane factor (OMF) lipoprotein